MNKYTYIYIYIYYVCTCICVCIYLYREYGLHDSKQIASLVNKAHAAVLGEEDGVIVVSSTRPPEKPRDPQGLRFFCHPSSQV